MQGLENYTPWDDREIFRFQFREGLFIRRGFEPERAERAAESLVYRDRNRDDRRMCVECAYWQRSHPSRNAVCAHTRIDVLPDTLQRCGLPFAWQTPA